MPPTASTYPTRDEAIAYLAAYEAKYALPVSRGVRVISSHAEDAGILLRTEGGGVIRSRAVISATGTWAAPVLPDLPGRRDFRGRVLHSAQYAGPQDFAGQRVLVVGGGNSGAQIFADLAEHASVRWVTKDPPTFLPDGVDGQYLFDQATARYKAIQEGRRPDPPRSLGDVVMVESLRALRDRGLLEHTPLFSHFTERGVVWPGGRAESVDAVILATGFRPSLAHLAPLAEPDARGRLAMDGLHAAAHSALFPLGYGDWTGFASATIIGVGRAARAVVEAISRQLAAA